MSKISPFRAWHAPPDLAPLVIAPPYDVMSEAEAREIVRQNPSSFVRVSRPDAVMPEGSDTHAPEAYATARREYEGMKAKGLIVQDPVDSYYLYGQKMGSQYQVGLVACFSTEEYDQNLVKKHEFTRPDKERDRVNHIDATNGQTGMVFLAYRDDVDLKELIAVGSTTDPLFHVTTEDGVEHTLWRIDHPVAVAAITAAAARLPAVYVADGHHRSAAASIVHRERAGQPGRHGWFVACLFPASSLNILAYNRAVKDLNGHAPEALVSAVRDAGYHCNPTSEPVPSRAGTCTMYLAGQWWLLTARDVPADPVARLDVSMLQDRVLAPLLNIDNPRTNKRIDFVGGIRGWTELVKLVDQGSHAVAFHMFPTQMDQLLDVADANCVMPPKSTWFEPKLRDAVAMHEIG
ncbi:MAG: DUF1015 domain-containing protein [Deltaproteobacteria bacterium]|nr:DUF1015 domain-containing protein [Deltaproteobacteria bacterium]